MILNDATGDIHKYGVITMSDEQETILPNGDVTLSASYTYDVGGQKFTFIAEDTAYGLKVGPCQVKMGSDTELDRLYNLTERKLSGVNGNVALGTDNQQYALSEHVAVYELVNGSYMLSNLSRVSNGGYALTGWYDKPASEGGCIRVIVARAQ